MTDAVDLLVVSCGKADPLFYSPRISTLLKFPKENVIINTKMIT
jgi:hypothetical protein